MLVPLIESSGMRNQSNRQVCTRKSGTDEIHGADCDEKNTYRIGRDGGDLPKSPQYDRLEDAIYLFTFVTAGRRSQPRPGKLPLLHVHERIY